ncbi:serine hydrolase domain-containing protein [Paenibacillus sp. PL2-23]|uniref:serine hydrolase domain-containing protein n=1 Tax=Paenibacillus sp. PL2-23 TaxID=2100729 RepID=UPI0030F9A568
MKRNTAIMLLAAFAFLVFSPAVAFAEALDWKEQELDDFAMQYFSEEKLEEHHLTAAAMAVVHNGKTVYSKAFGKPNIDQDTAATTDETMFRIGSISKTVVATAVMQLVEQGKLDMNTDINDYLTTFQIPETFSEPITLHHLLTHTSGLEEVYLNTVSLHYENRLPLEDYVKEYLPKRIREPGKAIAYINFGPTLAAYLVQLASGMPYEQYVKVHILDRLGMSHTDVDIRPEWLDRLALEYVYKNDAYKEIKIYSENTFPSGEIIASTDDVAKYMLGHLNEMSGRADVLFQSETKPIYDPQFRHHPAIPGYAYGFHERFHGGERYLEHGGTMAATNSYMLLSPDRSFGLYYVFVGEMNGRHIANDFLAAFVPEPEAEASPPPTAALPTLEPFEGVYAPNIYPVNDFTHFTLLTSEELTVEADGERLKLIGYGEEIAYDPVGDALFRSEEGDYIYFEPADGQLVYAGVVFERLPWYHISLNHNPIILLAAAAVFLVTAIAVPIQMGIQALRKAVRASRARGLLLLSISLCHLFLMGSFVYYVSTVDTMFYLNSEVPLLLKLAMAAPLLALLLTFVLAYHTVRNWRAMKLFNKLYMPFFVAASLIFLLIMQYYNLVGFYY